MNAGSHHTLIPHYNGQQVASPSSVVVCLSEKLSAPKRQSPVQHSFKFSIIKNNSTTNTAEIIFSYITSGVSLRKCMVTWGISTQTKYEFTPIVSTMPTKLHYNYITYTLPVGIYSSTKHIMIVWNNGTVINFFKHPFPTGMATSSSSDCGPRIWNSVRLFPEEQPNPFHPHDLLQYSYQTLSYSPHRPTPTCFITN